MYLDDHCFALLGYKMASCPKRKKEMNSKTQLSFLQEKNKKIKSKNSDAN